MSAQTAKRTVTAPGAKGVAMISESLEDGKTHVDDILTAGGSATSFYTTPNDGIDHTYHLLLTAFTIAAFTAGSHDMDVLYTFNGAERTQANVIAAYGATINITEFGSMIVTVSPNTAIKYQIVDNASATVPDIDLELRVVRLD